jgi:nicotinate-nucleotide pyrophosphorylase (carboxylating)
MTYPLPNYLNEEALQAYILKSLQEDLGSGDATLEALGLQTRLIKAKVLAKEVGVAAGLKVAQGVFLTLDRNAAFQPLIQDGESFHEGQAIAQTEGHAGAILSGERVTLNFLMRLSGIATHTHLFVTAVSHTKAKILDTRKTTPGLRPLEKWAVLLGGGQNHRLGLFDMILIKENHVALAGGVGQALKRTFAKKPLSLPIEIEVRNLGELKEAVEFPVSRILLDNFELQDLQKAVGLVNGKRPLEVSGGVTLENVRSIAETGVDFISVGRLTHSAKAIDLSLLVV